jgi:hypothetical protein
MAVPEVIQSVEGLHRAWPPFERPVTVGSANRIHDALADLLWASGCARVPINE